MLPACGLVVQSETYGPADPGCELGSGGQWRLRHHAGGLGRQDEGGPHGRPVIYGKMLTPALSFPLGAEDAAVRLSYAAQPSGDGVANERKVLIVMVWIGASSDDSA